MNTTPQKQSTERTNEMGKRLAETRKLKKLSQSEVAKEMGVTQSSLSQLELGHRSWSVGSIIKLIKFYNVSYENIFGNLDAPVTLEETPPCEESEILKSVLLLDKLAKSSASDEIYASVKAYIEISVYRILRYLYTSNPHNSSAIFGIDEQQADLFIADFLKKEPVRMASLIKASPRISKTSIELPVKESPALREYIAKCEQLLSLFMGNEGKG